MNVVHRDGSLPHGEVHGEENTHMEILLRRDLWILIFFIDLIHGLFQEGRRLLAVCITQSCPVPTVTS